MYCECLAYDGFAADAAEDGPAGLAKAIALRPDLIVLDYSMPRMDGGEVLRRLKADDRTRAIPVIMLTAMPELVLESVKTACAAFLEKPCQPDRLVKTISGILEEEASPARTSGHKTTS
ncbi:MAG: response regulator [Myxococcota bacterium]|nr:response regulator [Myxococcota bacterium]